MFQRLDLRYRTSPDSDEERATAIFSGAVLVYRALPAMHELVDCLREITQREIDPIDPCLAEAALGSAEFRHRAGRARQIVRQNGDVASLFKAVLVEAGVDISATFYDHFKLRFQPAYDTSRTRYMRDLPPHRDTWGSNIHAQVNWWAPIWPVAADRTIGIFPSLWNAPVPNTSPDWNYHKLIHHLKADRNTSYPMLPHCSDPPSHREAVPIVLDPGDVMAFSGAHLHCSMPNKSGVARISTETRTVSAQDLLYSRAAKNIDCDASVSHFDWFRHLETGESLAHHVLGKDMESSHPADFTP